MFQVLPNSKQVHDCFDALSAYSDCLKLAPSVFPRLLAQNLPDLVI
jgi:hypothetical protein